MYGLDLGTRDAVLLSRWWWISSPHTMTTKASHIYCLLHHHHHQHPIPELSSVSVSGATPIPLEQITIPSVPLQGGQAVIPRKVGIQKQDPDYLRAKYAFTRDLIQFHESRGTGLQCDPKINGKEVDLYLLYQIVTSHGGWEKINLRNEWDKLLEHFHLPRSTNGGLAIKQIYLRYLELYEKIHYLGEDVDAKEEPEDEYESDFRGRRRFPNKLTASSSHHHHHSSSSSHAHSHHHHHSKEITDHNRSQLGLSSRLVESSDYDGLLLSLQSPLPNEQDMAISVCTLLSNETKHVLRFSKSPAILNMLLAHAGIYQDCGMRHLMEETYKEWRDMDYAEFWEDVLHHPDTRQLLCECFVKKVNVSLGLTEDEGSILSQIREIEDGDLPEEEKFSLGTALHLKLTRLREAREALFSAAGMMVDEGETTPTPTPAAESSQSPDPDADATATKEPSPSVVMETDENASTAPDVDVRTEESAEGVTCNGIESSCTNTNTNDEESESVKLTAKVEETVAVASIVEVDEEPVVEEVKTEIEETRMCCPSCPCQRLELVEATTSEEDGSPSVDFSIQRPRSKKGHAMVDEAGDGPMNSLPFSLKRTQNSGDKVGQRICQIAHILRNLSFEQDNALVMSKNPTLMRFLLITANCNFSSLAQTSFDIIGNIASHLRLEEPLRDPLSSMFLTVVTSGVFSTDRFKILRSLEAIRELTKVEGNENILTRYIESRVYRRMCDLLTLSDIMLLIYTLECILSMTGLGEAVCDEIVRVQGSVATLVSLVTVEAQSYGPKGCILMRVVETVTGTTATASSSQPSSSAPSPVPSSSQSLAAAATPQQQQSMVAISQSVVVPPTQHLLQQQLQQPPNPIYSPAPPAAGLPSAAPARPSPANSPGLKIVTGTTVVPPVIQGQGQFGAVQQQVCKLTSISGQLVASSSGVLNNSQVFSHPAPCSSPSLINHLSSSSSVAYSSSLSSPFPQFQTQTVSAIQLSTTTASLAPPPPKPSALPSSSFSESSKMILTNSCNNGSVSVAPGSHSLPPGATIVVIQQPNASASPAVSVQPVTTTVNGVPQISNHSLSQHHVVTPSISLVTPRGTLSEEAWAIAWLKGTFESSGGTSIEQGEIYRMYSAARKNPNVVLSLEQFVQCVRCAYGSGVGPVIKQFGGGTSLPFFEGIKPKIAIRAVAVSPAQLQNTSLKTAGVAVAGSNAVVAASAPTATTTNPQLHQQNPAPAGAPPTTTDPQAQLAAVPSPVPAILLPPAAVSQPQDEGEAVAYVDPNVNNNNDNGSIDGPTHPVSVNIPTREAKPSLSPILQATLSQPPKAKINNSGGSPTGNTGTPTTSNRSKSPKRKNAKQSSRQKKQAAASTSSASSVLSQKLCGPPSKGNSAFSPASSAIRSLLASKVAQRQQNKLHQQLPKSLKSIVNDKGNLSGVNKEDTVVAYSSTEVVKVNGIGPDGSLDKIEESSASSSLLSSDGSDNSGANKSAIPITSFHGVLHNGQASSEMKNELNLEGAGELDGVGKNRGHMKGMLIDLLERRVPSREPVNGIVAGREIRISEKGLELIEKMEESLAAGSSGPTLVNHSNNSTCPSSDVQESQKMTFYSSTSDAQVTLQGQAPNAAGPGLSGSSGGVTLLSGGGGGGSDASSLPSTNSTMALRPGGQQVKLSGKIVRVIEHAGVPLCAPTLAAVATSTAIAEVQSTTVPATAFCRGDGLITSSSADSATATTTPANGEVTYYVDDSGHSAMIVDVVESVLANANAIALDSGSNGDGGGGDGSGQNMIVIEGDGDSAAAASCSNRHNDNGMNYAATESNCNNGGGAGAAGDGGGGGGDLLEQFSQFSDLIMVPPEQLASLKRPSSPLPAPGTTSVVPGNNNNDSTGEDLPPPAKKQVMDGTIAREGEQVDQTQSTILSLTVSGSNVQLNSTTTSVAIANSIASTVAMAVSAATTTPTTAPSLPPGSGAQVVQLPLRLSVNPQNPQQLTFTRQLVLPSGQQLLLSTGNAQSGLQGQVIISKPQGSNTDQMPKAIIILQPQHQKAAGSSQPVTTSQNLPVSVSTQQQLQTTTVMATTVSAALQSSGGVATTAMQQQQRPAVIPPGNLKPQIVTLQHGGTVSATQQVQKMQQTPIVHHQIIGGPMQQTTNVQSAVMVSQQQQQAISQGVALQHQLSQQHRAASPHQPHGLMIKSSNCGQFEGIRSSSFPHLTSDQLDLEYPFLCEWAGCGLRFLRPQQVSMHALKAHCPEALVDAVRCEWGQNGCDPLLRKRFSLMTHLQDRHCSKQALEMALYRRKNKIEPPPVPQQPIHHPGYAPNAAFHAIKRHAMSFMSTKEHLHDDNEGPVTKSIRLTAALILRNLVNYSGLGRRMLHGYESHLSSIAMSNVESSRTIAQLLHDMNDQPRSSK